ncbi:MAG: flavin reductase [Coriobacteriales bacterium]|jgi:flavin reductase (DIM6/NTAB) family NADH-FMN oxidoreductase RutF|nr:flavin reductase [Coriobacteriales bacterium]
MSTLREISPFEISGNAIERIGHQWMLIAAAKPDGTVNAMTAAWGGLGFIWQQPVAFVFIRPQRCTKTFVEAASSFSLSFLGSEYRDALNYLGSVSGFEQPDKVANSGLTLAYSDAATPSSGSTSNNGAPSSSDSTSNNAAPASGGTPYFAEAELVLVCERLYQQDMLRECFLATENIDRFYDRIGDSEDFHTLYIAAITKALACQRDAD